MMRVSMLESVTDGAWLRRRFAWLWALALVAAFVSALLLDVPLAEVWKPLFGHPVHVAAVRLTELGRAEPYFILTSLGLILGWVLKRPRVLGFSIHALSALLLSGGVVQGIKHIVGRQRPYADVEMSARHFDFFISNYEWHSLPSGHSQVAFTVAAILTLRWPKAMWVWIFLAAAIATTRVLTLNHWLSDTIIGAAVGWTTALVAFRWVQVTRFRMAESAVENAN